jgi:uncharacterized surface protein with fasciclin (FAS1) repeats
MCSTSFSTASNEAFVALGPQKLAFLQSLEGFGQLHDMLLYHIVPTRVVASINILEGTTTQLETLAGDLLSVTKTTESGIASTLLLNQGQAATTVAAEATSANHVLLANNGIIHVIDAVLQPHLGKEEGTGASVETSSTSSSGTIMSVSTTICFLLATAVELSTF